MSDVTIWHNPKCSKSRKTLELLRERGVEPAIVLYRDEPPSARELDRVLTALEREPRELMRTKEAVYAELGLGDPALSRQQLIDAMVANPILIERPVVLRGERAAVGRPPEDVLALLDD